jgi:Ca-activated chloride channel family protein
MSFGNPWFLLALVIPALGFYGLRRYIRSSPGQRWPAITRVAISGDRLRAVRQGASRPAVLVLAAITLAILALAQPRWGEKSEDLYIHTREVMIALDLSRSMLAEDETPSRLERAKEVTNQLLDALKGESVGLIVFAGTSFVQVPLSSDYQIIREFLPALNPDYMPQGGSDYKGMLEAALEGFGDGKGSDRYLFVLSDGESSTDDWEQRLDAIDARQVHVVSVGFGSDKGSFIPDGYGGYLQDQDGGTINSKFMPATLEALATRSNGKYLTAATLKDEGDVEDLVEATVDTGQKGEQNAETSFVQVERFQWFLLPALLLALAGMWREFQQRPTPRDIRQQKGNAGAADSAAAAQKQKSKTPPRPDALAACLALFLVFVFAPTVQAHFDNEAEFDVRQEFTSNPTERLRAIARHLGEFGYDAYDLRLLVESTIRYGIDQQREQLPVSEGAIKDAMDAANQGERMDKALVNWSYYRSQLTAILEKNGNGPQSEEENGSKKELMDEEDNPPMVTGEGNQSFASDSFGQGSATKTDATLGEIEPPKDMPRPKRDQKPPLPKNVRAAMAARNVSAGPDDAVLKLQQQRLVDIGKNDSPGRVHQLLAEMSGTQAAPSNKFDW